MMALDHICTAACGIGLFGGLFDLAALLSGVWCCSNGNGYRV
jgi:hypothetical protein